MNAPSRRLVRLRALAVALPVAATLLGAAPAHAAFLVVSETNLNGWTITNNGQTATGAFVNGPAPTPFGSGSFRQRIDLLVDEQRLATKRFDGTLLSAITDLSYFTRVSGTEQRQQAPFMRLYVDLDGNGTYQREVDDVLNFEPAYQNGGYPGDAVPNQCGGNPLCVNMNTWQFWNTKAGGWWSSRDGNGGPPLRTLAKYVQIPGRENARLVTDPVQPSLVVQAGWGGPWGNFEGFVDGVTFVGGVHNFTFDFEGVPTNVTLSMAPALVREGDSLFASGNAFPNRPVTLRVSDTSDPPVTVTIGATTRADGTYGPITLTSSQLSSFKDGTLTGIVDAEAPDLSISQSNTATATKNFSPLAPVITSPLPGAIVGAPNFSVTGNGPDGSTITVFEGALALGSAASNGSWSLPLSFSAGQHTIHAVANKNGSDGPPSASVTFTVDLGGPAAPIITAPAAGSLNRSSVTLQGTAERNMTIRLRESTRVIGSVTVGPSGRWTTFATFTHGLHTVVAELRNSAGILVAESAPRTFDVDALAPTVAITAPERGALIAPGTDAQVEGAATDEHAVAAVELRYYDMFGNLARIRYAQCTGCGSNGNVTWSDSGAGLLLGTYSVQAVSIDLVGNRSNAAVTSYTDL